MRRSRGVVAAVACVLGLLGCHRGGWPAEGKQNFVAGCRKNNPKPGACECVADALEKTMAWPEFKAFTDTRNQGGAPPPAQMAKIREAVLACNPEGK